MADEADHITLSEMIEHVAGQLNEARLASDRRADPKVLVLDECVLELHYEVTKVVGAGIEVKVINASGSRDRVMGNAITVKFKPYGVSQTFVAETPSPSSGSVRYGTRPEKSNE